MCLGVWVCGCVCGWAGGRAGLFQNRPNPRGKTHRPPGISSVSANSRLLLPLSGARVLLLLLLLLLLAETVVAASGPAALANEARCAEAAERSGSAKPAPLLHRPKPAAARSIETDALKNCGDDTLKSINQPCWARSLLVWTFGQAYGMGAATLVFGL